MRKEQGVFQFTHWSRDPANQEEWFAWLQSRNIPVALVAKEKGESGETYHSIWRACWTAQRGEDVFESKTSRWQNQFVVVKEANGFTEHKNGRG